MTFLDTSDLKNEEIALRLDHTFPGYPARNRVPAYRFDVLNAAGQKVGTCDLRIGHNEGLYYGGNIGYAVDESFRGHQYAEKACRLLFELARRHEMDYLIISCQPTNLPSRRTCERLGGKLLEIAELPPDNDMRINDGHTHECIFRFELSHAKAQKERAMPFDYERDDDDADDHDDDDAASAAPGQQQPVEPSLISADQALEIALNSVGTDRGSIQQLELELDHGSPSYELEFKLEGLEHDFEIDAGTGRILRHEAEPED